jgi:hypothetical protein
MSILARHANRANHASRNWATTFTGVAVAIIVAACSGATTTAPQKAVANGQPTAGTSDDAGGGQASPNGNPPPSGDDDDASSPTPVTTYDSGPVDANACSATANEVVMVGDSYFALSGEITVQLQSLATAGGALASGGAYRHYYESGANMYPYPDSTVTPIPTQFSDAVTASPDIKYVIMDGGGNDILLQNTQCIEVSPDAGLISSECITVIDNAIATAKTLFQTMKTAGVEKIIYFFYPHLPTTGKPSVNVVLDYSYPLVKAACDASPIPCYFIDTRAAFEGNASYIGPDHIHPTTAGSDVIAGLIWGVMQQECVAL